MEVCIYIYITRMHVIIVHKRTNFITICTPLQRIQNAFDIDSGTSREYVYPIYWHPFKEFSSPFMDLGLSKRLNSASLFVLCCSVWLWLQAYS